MSRIFKRLAFGLSVPAALAVGGWAQWTTLTAQDATVAVATADTSRVDVLRERPDPSAADARITSAPVLDRTAGNAAQPPVPSVKANTELAQKKIVTYRIKPAPIPDRTAGSGAQPPVPAVTANTELAPADAVTYPPIKPVPVPDRTARDGTTERAEPLTPAVRANTEFAHATAAPEPAIEPAVGGDREAAQKAEPVEQQPSSSLANSPSTSKSSANRSSTTETKKERQAALPRETKEGRSTRDREREGESRRSKDDAANARKTIVAMRQRAEPARYQWSGPATPALRDHPMRLRAWAASSPATCH
jgi:hypothetical protein